MKRTSVGKEGIPHVGSLSLRARLAKSSTSRRRVNRRRCDFSSGERTRPRVLSLAPRQRLFLVEPEKHFGEAPKWAREARALPGKEARRGNPSNTERSEKLGIFVRDRFTKRGTKQHPMVEGKRTFGF